MSKIGIALAGLLVMAAATAATLPWYVGMQTEQSVRAGLKHPRGAGAPFAVRLVQYQRGWTRSAAVHRVSLKADPDVYFDILHDIDHLPDPRGALVRIRSTPRWPQKVQAAADYYFGKQPAVTVTTLVDFDHNMTLRIQSPAFSKPMLTQPEVKLTWGGANGTLGFAAASKMTLDLDMPRLAFEGGGALAAFTGAALRGDWTTADSQLDWQGETRFAVSEMTFDGPRGGALLKGFEATMLQRNQGDTILVGYGLRVKEGEATGVGVDRQGFSEAVLELELDRLDKQALNRYFDDLAGIEQSGVSSEARVRLAAHLWLGLLSELLKGSPEIRVKQLGVKTAQGAASGSAVLGFDGDGFTQVNSSLELLARARFSASAEISAALLRAWMAKGARVQAVHVLAQRGTFPDEMQVRTLSDQLVQQQLKALETMGLIKPEGDKFVLRAQMAGGKLTVNGAPADQLLGPMLAPPATPKPALRPGEHAA